VKHLSKSGGLANAYGDQSFRTQCAKSEKVLEGVVIFTLDPVRPRVFPEHMQLKVVGILLPYMQPWRVQLLRVPHVFYQHNQVLVDSAISGCV
jgi:hypothetical protein